MRINEIKERYSMRDILQMYGLQPDRSGFLRCPFHNERHASFRVYAKDFHCFGCGANGDIFTFVQEMEGCSFREAFERLGGTYDRDPSFAERLAVYKQQKSVEQRKKQAERDRAKQEKNSALIGQYMTQISSAEPLSDEWTEAYNRLQYQIYLQSELTGIPW